MTILLAVASAAEWGNAAQRAAVLRAAADIIALEAGKRPDIAVIADFAAAAAQAEGRPSAALLLPLAAAGEPGAEAYLRQAQAAGVKCFGFSADDYQVASILLAEKVNQETIFAGLQVLLILPFSAQLAQDFSRWLDFVREWGFPGVVLQLSDNSAETAQNRSRMLAALEQCLQALQQAGLQAGVSNVLQMADVPRLLALHPDILGFRPIAGNVSFTNLRLAFEADDKDEPAVEPRPAKQSPAQSGETDKILVSDYIVPMRIGAYNHEKGAAQRVCFNVAAEITRLSGRPHNMNDIFSYDIILDAIARLAAQGHWEFVETVAEEVAAVLLRFPRVAQVMVRAEKLDLAPRAVGIEICRCKS